MITQLCFDDECLTVVYCDPAFNGYFLAAEPSVHYL